MNLFDFIGAVEQTPDKEFMVNAWSRGKGDNRIRCCMMAVVWYRCNEDYGGGGTDGAKFVIEQIGLYFPNRIATIVDAGNPETAVPREQVIKALKDGLSHIVRRS
jgi:hypothetical protein